MIVDTSVLVAILLDEPESAAFLDAMSSAPRRYLSSASYVELAAVIDGRRHPTLSGILDAAIRRLRIEIVPLSVEQARVAREACGRFGRGSGHPARLNLGDCLAYALARDMGEPLLFKGDDFKLTDIEIVIEPIRSRRLSEIVTAYVTSA